MKVYVAGKVSKNSSFGTHHWRDKFVDELASLSGMKLQNLDPLAFSPQHTAPEEVFGADCRLIKECDVLIAYLSDDISVGGSQEILIAKYFGKPVIALAPRGGKFNGCEKEMLGTVIKDYKDPFVFSTCDVVCGDNQEVADALMQVSSMKPKTLSIIDEYSGRLNQ